MEKDSQYSEEFKSKMEDFLIRFKTLTRRKMKYSSGLVFIEVIIYFLFFSLASAIIIGLFE